MRRVLGLTILLLVAGTSLAATVPEFPPDAVAHKFPLAGEVRLRYLLRQIELTEQQAKHAEELLAALPENADLSAIIERDRQLRAEFDAAKAEKSVAEINAAAKGLKRLSKDKTLDDAYFAKLEPDLTEPQKQMLAEARARLTRHLSGGVRPGDLNREANRLNLTEDQKAAMFQAFKRVTKKLGPALRPDETKKTELLNMYSKDVWEILTPEQRKPYEYRIYVMRPDLIDEGLYVPRSAVKWPEVAPKPKSDHD